MDARKNTNKKTIIAAVVIFLLGVAVLAAFYVGFMRETGSETSLTEEYRLDVESEEDGDSILEEGELLRVQPSAIQITHSISADACPNLFDGQINIEGLENGTWVVDNNSFPEWLVFNERSGDFPGQISGLAFTCDVESFEPRTLSARINIQAKNNSGRAVDVEFFDIFIQIIE